MIEQLDTGYASLSTDSSDVPIQVSGIAIGEDDITRGGSGKETLWPRETLEAAADDLQGAKLATDVDHTADNPNPQTPVEAIIGEVTWSGYKPGVGVLYEAELGDEEIASKVENGWLEVSPLVSRELEALDDGQADYKATEIKAWRDLATVAKGAAPSNEIQLGEQPMKAEALHATVESLAEMGDLTEDTLVSWNSSGERDAYGMVVDTISEGEYDGAISGDVTVSAPAALIQVHQPGSGGWEATETMVAHKPDTLTVVDELPNPESLAADMTPPESAQDHAQEVLDWRDDEDKDVQGMTETGWNRAEQLASGEELSVSDIQEISAWFARHGEAEYELNEEGMEPWEDNGRVAIKGWGGPPMRGWSMDKREQLVDEGELEALSAEALKEVAGVEFDDTMGGKLDESEIPNDEFESHYLYPEDTKSESSYPVVDADGNLRKGNVDAAWGLGARGGVDEDDHDSRLMELAQEFDSPPEWATDESESMGSGVGNPTNWEACSVSLPQEITQNDDGTQGDKSQSSVAGNSEETMTEEDTLTENEKAILKAAEDVEDATEALNEYAATEGPEIVESSEIEALREQVDTAKDLYAESLSERWDTDKDKIKSNFGLEALREEFETEDGDLDTEALIQNPESGEPEEDDTEALSDDANVEKAEALYNDYQTMNRPPKGLEEDITEALGVSDFDDAKEVLN